MRGMYVVFEGADGAGKSTTMRAVAQELQRRVGPIPHQLTYHPGSTPLGTHIRKLVKYPEQIDPDINIDPLSRQILYMVDTVSFVRQLLEPAISSGTSVFADRSSFISALVYGAAEGLKMVDIDRLFQLIVPPRMDRLYVLRCPWQVGRERLKQRNDLDHFERKPEAFFARLEEIYDRLITGPTDRTLLVTRSVSPQDLIYVDATAPLDRVVDIIVSDLVKLRAELEESGE